MTDTEILQKVLDVMDLHIFELEEAKTQAKDKDLSHLESATLLHQKAREAFSKGDLALTNRLLMNSLEEIKMGNGEVEQLKILREKVREIVRSRFT